MPTFASKKLSFDIILAVFLVILSVLLNQLLVNDLQLFKRWDNLFYDFESASIYRPIDDNIVIVAIDENSLQKLGRWPWSRSIHADLLDQLTAIQVAAVGMDILFMEPDLVHPKNDQRLAAAIRRNGHVVLPVLTIQQDDHFTVTKPLKDIAENAQLAHVNMHFDPQGVVRHLDLQLDLIDNQVLPAMALTLSRQLFGHVEPLDLATQKNILITFSGPPGKFRQLSYVDVLFDPAIRQSLHGKVVLIGMTAEGLGSRIATPVSKNNRLMSGVELQANALATIHSGEIIQAVKWSVYSPISLILIVIPIFLFRFFNSSMGLMLVLVFSIFTSVTSFYLLNTHQLWFSPLPTLLCLILSYPLWSWRKLEQLGQSLFNEHEKASATLKAIGEAVITTDKLGYIEFMNPAAEKMLACRLVDVRQKPFTEICQFTTQNNTHLLDSHSLTSEIQKAEARVIRNQQQEEFAVHFSSSPLHAEDGIQTGVVYALKDLTEIININRKVAFIASHDTLTGLPNRILLKDRLEQAINRASREKLNFAVLFIDLDGFKKINDGMGHICGDLVLQEVAKRLNNWIRKSDTISRWGSDEFIILLANLSAPSDAADIAVKIIQSLSLSFLINEQEVFVTPSIGISLFPEDGQTAEVLLAKSDTAMYNIKKHGRNNFCFYSQDLENQAKEKLVIETELRQAILTGEFELYYQPQIDLTTDHLIGTEALIRWRHPDKGLISPDNFIPLSEDIGLIIPIGEWVIKTVCRQLKSWQDLGLPLVKVAINLSAHQFIQKDLVNIITREIENNGLVTNSLQVEITESMMIHDIDQAIQTLSDLKSAGISIAVDDFGTGYSSLEYLKKFPIDKLKIDKSFVDSVIQNSDDASIVNAIIALGHSMKMQIIAEGVETKEQALFLQEHQCDYGQGYFYSKPIPAAEMGVLIEKFSQEGNIG
jgi:diguanylate cyclase (GGDEF)-like protein/PAS domain S-box-containing protein